MSVTDAVKTGFKKYSDFKGRATRSEYWWFAIFIGVVSFVLSKISTGFEDLFILATFIPGLAVAIRRMHDVDKSGWFILIPFYNFFLAVSAGTPGPNRFGDAA